MARFDKFLKKHKLGKFRRTGEVLVAPPPKKGPTPEKPIILGDRIKEERDKRAGRDPDIDPLPDKKTTVKKEPIILKKKTSIIEKGKELLEKFRDRPKFISEELQEKTFAGTVPIGVGPLSSLGKIAKGEKDIATVSATISAHRLSRAKAPGLRNVLQSEKLLGVGTRTAVRSFVGRPAKSGIDKLFKAGGLNAKNAPIASRYGSNLKSTGLTISLLKKSGFINEHSTKILAILGSYPFAGFIKEEAIQQLELSSDRSLAAGDIEGAELAANELEELLDSKGWEKLVFAIPFANVTKQVIDFVKGAEIALKNLRKRIQLAKEKLGEPTFEEQRIASDEAAFERKREFAEEESKRFEDIRKETEEREAEQREETTAFFEQTAEENRRQKLEERARDAEYFRLIREGKFEEAQALLDIELKGG